MKSKTINIKHTLIIMASVAVVAGISYASIDTYHQHRKAVAAHNEQVAVIERLQEKDRVMKQARYDASISRLVSICMTQQQRYDALPAKQQALEVRPVCTVEVQ